MKKKKRGARRRGSKLATAVAWYRPDQWQRLRETAEDADCLHETYEAWLSSVDEMISAAAAAHILIEKMDINVEELIAWCNVRGLAINGKARSEYVSAKLRQKYEVA